MLFVHACKSVPAVPDESGAQRAAKYHPATLAQVLARCAASTVSHMSSHAVLQGSRILVADDDPIVRCLIAGYLGGEQYEVHAVTTGEEALATYATLKPDLVLLDVRFPGIDGFETCRQLHRYHGDECAPVMFITSAQHSEDVVAGFEAGGVDYITKPVSQTEMLARIRTHLSQRLLRRQLAEANARKNKFLGIAAHDLRNPLSSVRTLAEFLADGTFGPVTPEQKESLEMIHEASNGMLAMVNELLDVAVIEGGVLRINKEPTDLTELAAKVVRFSTIAASRKNMSIELSAKPACIAQVDSGKIRQVIENLLSNAIKYSPVGSRIHLTVSDEQNQWAIAVRDEGPGIPEAERHRLFQDFGRLSVQPTGGEKSVGLGLAICRRIVEGHAGSIAATNLAERGCEFRVTLPKPEAVPSSWTKAVLSRMQQGSASASVF